MRACRCACDGCERPVSYECVFARLLMSFYASLQNDVNHDNATTTKIDYYVYNGVSGKRLKYEITQNAAVSISFHETSNALSRQNIAFWYVKNVNEIVIWKRIHWLLAAWIGECRSFARWRACVCACVDMLLCHWLLYVQEYKFIWLIRMGSLLLLLPPIYFSIHFISFHLFSLIFSCFCRKIQRFYQNAVQSHFK